jgi:hypothetical protein
MQIIPFRDVLLHNLVDSYQCFGGTSWKSFYPGYCDRRFPQNVVTCLPKYVAFQKAEILIVPTMTTGSLVLKHVLGIYAVRMLLDRTGPPVCEMVDFNIGIVELSTPVVVLCEDGL